MGLLGGKSPGKREGEQIRRLVQEQLEAQCEAVVDRLLPTLLEDLLPRLVKGEVLLIGSMPDWQERPDRPERRLEQSPEDLAGSLEARVKKLEECFLARFFSFDRPGYEHKETIVRGVRRLRIASDRRDRPRERAVLPHIGAARDGRSSAPKQAHAP